MLRFSPRTRWVVVPTVVATATLVTAVAWAGATPARSPGTGHLDRSAAVPAPVESPAAARTPLHRSAGTPARGHRRPAPRPTRPTVAPTPTTPAPAPTTAPTTAPTAVPTTVPPTTLPPVPTTPPATTPPPPAPTTAPAGGVTGQVVALTNAERAKAGCGPLAVNGILTTVAQAHSQDMATRNYFSHDSQDGRSPFDRMTAAGYRYSSAAENIAAGQRTAQDVVTGWMNSAGHRANILNCGLREIGVGYATSSSSQYGSYWTQDFGTPR